MNTYLALQHQEYKTFSENPYNATKYNQTDLEIRNRKETFEKMNEPMNFIRKIKQERS